MYIYYRGIKIGIWRVRKLGRGREKKEREGARESEIK